MNGQTVENATTLPAKGWTGEFCFDTAILFLY